MVAHYGFCGTGTMTTESAPTAEQRELSRAAELGAPLRRAAKLARSNGLGYAVFGALTILLSLPLDIAGLLLGGCLLAVGIAQQRTASRLVAGDPTAPGVLARNELLLLAAITVYAVAQMTILRAGTSADLEMLGDSAGVDVAGLVDAVAGAVYGGVIVISLVYQGGMALYFRRRLPIVERYANEVPEWARATLAKL
jgi:hypothetical protein